ncbi:MAG: hypothetical protein JKY48_15500 [Flavobacteriales bacterium]|nr:hypothetical protein [Flavobacteriales bacterium]
MKNLVIVLLCSISISSFSQEKKKDKYQFAHTYFGIETEVLPQNGSFTTLNNQGNFDNKTLPSFASTRFVIGGTHFWDHADFYVSIPIVQFSIKGSKDAFIENGVLTGFRYFPLKIKPNSIRPFAGVGFGSPYFRSKGANGEGATQTNRQWYYEGGISYRYKGSKLFDLGIRYFNDKTYHYANSRKSFENVSLNQLSILFSYKRIYDFTQGYAKKKQKEYLKKVFDALEKNNELNTFSIGIGYSASIPLETTEYANKIPFLNQETTKNGNVELGIAYYSHDWDASARISYRPLKQKETAYNYTYLTTNHSIALEAFKFIGDYHGFVPFVGPYISSNNYKILEKDMGKKVSDYKANKLGYGIVFGWDIRLSRVDYLIMRTNLRYTPNLNYTKNGLDYTNKQIEFNFIQLVYYPKRHKIQKPL